MSARRVFMVCVAFVLSASSARAQESAPPTVPDTPAGEVLLLISVPVRRAINPITHTNREGVGVKPNVKVPSEKALETAQRLIRERMLKR